MRETSDLGTVLERSPGGLPPVQVSQLATAVAAALDHLHTQGWVHGDVRPSTIQPGPHGQWVLSDGVAPLDPIYAAPERLQDGPVDGRADQYSLACIVFRLLTGRDPYPGPDRTAVAAAHLGQPVPSVRESQPYLPPDLDTVVGRAMAKDPRHRHASCGEFATALAASLTAGSSAPPGPRRNWWVAAALIAAVAVLTTAVVFAVDGATGSDDAGSNDAGSADVAEWDGKLYPQEIESVYRPLARDELLQSMIGQPEPVWTAPLGGEPSVLGGGDNIVVARVDTSLIGLDAGTGAPLWPAVELPDAPFACEIYENRIGCAASGGGSDSTVFFLDAATGTLVETVKIPNRDLMAIVVAGDRFVVTTSDSDPEDKGFAAGYTTEGDEVWRYEGSDDLYVVASQGILVDGSSMSDDVRFISTADGREVLESTRAKDHHDHSWVVFHGGIAIQNDDWTGTDIYDLDGTKRSSVPGWEPVRYQSKYTNPAPLPLLAQLEDTGYPDDHTIAAANPETGHLLWRLSDWQITTQIATIDEMILVKVTDPENPRDPEDELMPSGGEFVRVYDAYSGKPGSPPIDMTGDHGVEIYWIKSDGTNLIYEYLADDGQYSPVAYDLATGERSWEVTLASRAVYLGGTLVATTGEESVSLFG